MESRKRPHSAEDEPTIQKKRILTGVNGTPHVNGVVSTVEELNDADNLELFRKEAIFRRMKHYSREHERSQAQIAELEQRRNTCEAGMVAMAACWEQLVTAIRTLARPEDLPPPDADTKGLFDLTEYVSRDHEPSLRSALETNVHSTQSLITSFIQLSTQKQPTVLRDEAYRQCQKAQTECLALKSEITLVRKKLHETETQNKKYHAELVAAETRADRLRSSTVLAMQARASEDKKEPKGEETEEPKLVAPPSPPQPQANGDSQVNVVDESDVWQELAKTRENKIIELEQETAVLRDEINILRLELKHPSHDVIAESPSYKIILAHASKLEYTINESGDELPRLKDELVQLRSTRKEWEESILAAADTSKEELRSQFARKEADNLRLRDQREQLTAEVNERKHKDNVKMASLDELKGLAASRSERIAVLESELKRHKAQLAANVGNEDLLQFFLGDNSNNLSYVADLKKRVADAEARAASLEQSLSRFDEDHPEVRQHITAEAEARQQLADVTKQLEKYQSVYGDSSSLPPDVQQLSEQLQRQEAEVLRLRLLDKQRGEAETSLYAELDKLSAAWEALDRQVKNKVFDLTAMEERLQKMGHDRGKSENKFYAAMRDKEAIENERKNLSRNLEKQAKMIEKLQESEKGLTQLVGVLEKEVTLWQKGTDELKKKLEGLEFHIIDWQHRAEGERIRASEFRSLLKEREAAVEEKNTQLRRAEENLVRLRKESERQADKYKLLSTGTSSQKEAELQKEVDKLMIVLKCSTCKMAMRSCVITKCMHSFCRQCVDTRISTRQRKCPACNLGFASSDVQQLYFQ
ncbi:hypothetical protein PILCRDRAFT_809908 [Piloderma croceum F 1598]|uniref:E3 ubiquitin protein ligase n=1 Tax=Piloderma croceum (strain F 1598) TaxID=765440 RepID=A0A0C3GJU6_PILCF|nr:hypothetical protein PILCRDRAFT_809908 [Piloderma croceum F 1598]